MRQSIKYTIFFFFAVAGLNIWFMAAGSDAQFQGIYSAIAGIFSALVIEGRKTNRRKKQNGRKNL